MRFLKNIFTALLLTGVVLSGYSQENLFRNPSWETDQMKLWRIMVTKGMEKKEAGVLKLLITRNRGSFKDNGVGQKFMKPAPGFYKVSIDIKGDKISHAVIWIQIKLADGKFVYPGKTFPVKSNSMAKFRTFSCVFAIPENAEFIYIQCTARSDKETSGGVSLFSKPLFRKATRQEISGEPIIQGPKNVAKKSEMHQKYLQQIRKAIPEKHPRLFYSEAILADMKKKAASEELKSTMERMKSSTERSYTTLMKYYASDNGLGPVEPSGRRYHPLSEWGKTAGNAAVLYRITGEKKWADIGIDLLKKLTPWYNQRFKLKRAVSWYGFSRVLCVMAWDWLYDVMTPEDRDRIGKELISHSRKLTDKAFITMMCPIGEGKNGPGSGFYSAHCMMPWYAGIAFRGEGYDDAFAEKQLSDGLKGHLAMLENRNNMAGDDGGSVNSTPAYCYGTYNNVEFWFFLSWKVLTGKNISEDFPQMGLFPFWLVYAIFPGIDQQLYDFGSGSAWHICNTVDVRTVYHSLFRNFYRGAVCDLSDGIMATRVWKKGSWTQYDYLLSVSPFYPFFCRFEVEKYKRNDALYAALPKGYFFENLGQIYMHSGWTGKDTHALFTCGAKSPSHKEYDENNFVIYKGGFLALDSGTRSFDFTPDGRKLFYAHVNNYKEQSVAHNVILIRNEGEKFRGWRLDSKYIGNHEGMNKTTGGVVRSFETNRDFTYIAGDSTACYNPEKAKQVVRQFLFIHPDLFVIYDTVKSVRADQKKSWLLHTQEEPVIRGNSFETVQRDGRLICRTLLPEKALLTKIGGKGKEFWADGKNYPLGPHLEKNIRTARKKGNDAPLWGAWRMSVTAPEARKDNTFLHIIQVGMKKDFTRMIDTRLIREKGYEGTVFKYNGVDYTVLFDPHHIPGGRIKAVKDGSVLYDRPFTRKVQPQNAFEYLKGL